MQFKQEKTVLVTGGAGYVGSQTCKHLARSGYLPVTLDDLSTGHKRMVRWGPLEVGAVGDRALLSSLCKKFQPIAVIHCAAAMEVGESVRDPAKYYEKNVVDTLRMLEVMVEEGVENLVFSSTCATYGEVDSLPITENTPQLPINPYGWSKYMSEQMMKDFSKAYGLRYAFFRYFNVAGADEEGEVGEEHDPPCHVIPILFDVALGKRESFHLFGTDYPTRDGTCIRDYIHVMDLADAHLKGMRHLLEGKGSVTLNLGSEKGVSVKELIAVTKQVTGKSIPVQEAPRRPGDAPELVAESAKARKLLGWQASHSSLEKILKTAWDYHLSVQVQPKV